MLAIVDDEDYERCMEHIWTGSVDGKTQIKVRSWLDKKKNIYKSLQNFILNNNSKEKVITFMDGNQLNFQKENLKITNRKHVSRKRKGNNNSSSKYKGVSWDKSREKWRAAIMSNGKTMHLGRYDNEDDAALAYNEAAIELFGEHAFQNKIDEDNSANIIASRKTFKPRRNNGNSSKYRGVSIEKRSGKWLSQISKGGKKYRLGKFKTQKEAARAYDKKSIELYGDKAILNFLEGR
ncbi:AP2/ERF family transcription factor [Bacillus mycoides]|uniref:AP2/ERF family transcription factor n=1 Tax=Bacillus mycoides TaxID=1405 RepID=UPI003D65FBFB